MASGGVLNARDGADGARGGLMVRMQSSGRRDGRSKRINSKIRSIGRRRRRRRKRERKRRKRRRRQKKNIYIYKKTKTKTKTEIKEASKKLSFHTMATGLGTSAVTGGGKEGFGRASWE
jgi:hypothetical protein